MPAHDPAPESTHESTQAHDSVLINAEHLGVYGPLITAIRRAAAKRRRPYVCPTCGAAVETDRP